MNKKDIDWDNLGFYAHETKSMFKAIYTAEKKWQVEWELLISQSKIYK